MKKGEPPDAEPAPAEPASPVGYKRPPAAHRFKKGQSGNPRGRPKRKEMPKAADNGLMEDLVLYEAYRSIEIRENGQVESMPMIQAVMRSLNVSAAKGNLRAQQTMMRFVQAAEQRRLDDKIAAFEAIRAYKKMYQEEFAACERAGKPRPTPVPHPDDIVIDNRAGTVRFNGPVDDHHKGQWDAALEQKAALEEEIEALKKEAEQHPEDAGFREYCKEVIEHDQQGTDTLSPPGRKHPFPSR